MSTPTARYTPATRRTFYFIGVTTAQSSIMKVFPPGHATSSLAMSK
jgi:hypothetical protein